MLDVIVKYITANYVEALGVLLSFCYMFFSVRGKIWLWIFGFLSSICYLIVFYRSKFYAMGSLQLYYVAMSIYGFYFWITKREEDSTEFVRVSKMSKSQVVVSFAIAMICFGVLFFVIKNYTESPVPLGDSLTASLCIVGTWLLARKVVENWLFFIVADTVCIALFFFQQMYLTSLLFVVYDIMGIAGYCRWRRQLSAQ